MGHSESSKTLNKRFKCFVRDIKEFFEGGVKAGRPNTRIGFGSLNRPTNVLGISPETIAILGNDKMFNEARGLYSYSNLSIAMHQWC